MNRKIDKKSSCIIILALSLVLSLLLNVYQGVLKKSDDFEIGNNIYKSFEEIRTRNESILIMLDTCLTTKMVDKEEILTLYKNYSLINIAELNLWEHYLNSNYNINSKYKVESDKVETNPNEILSRIEQLIYTTLVNYMGSNEEAIELGAELSADFTVIKEIARELDHYFCKLTEESLKELESDDKSKKVIKEKYWIDLLNEIERINEKYKNYVFKL